MCHWPSEFLRQALIPIWEMSFSSRLLHSWVALICVSEVSCAITALGENLMFLGDGIHRSMSLSMTLMLALKPLRSGLVCLMSTLQVFRLTVNYRQGLQQPSVIEFFSASFLHLWLLFLTSRYLTFIPWTSQKRICMTERRFRECLGSYFGWANCRFVYNYLQARRGYASRGTACAWFVPSLRAKVRRPLQVVAWSPHLPISSRWNYLLRIKVHFCTFESGVYWPSS